MELEPPSSYDKAALRGPGFAPAQDRQGARGRASFRPVISSIWFRYRAVVQQAQRVLRRRPRVLFLSLLTVLVTGASVGFAGGLPRLFQPLLLENALVLVVLVTFYWTAGVIVAYLALTPASPPDKKPRQPARKTRGNKPETPRPQAPAPSPVPVIRLDDDKNKN